ncbi:LLM class flavin-dependent oxidoreductase [Aliarcobacter vitoriensis]|uniref:LLM class flavin-dependent oxidoreductase n=1 Tax=Aliarcobacter vitoriensis TaxID=2011099 RepID=A0A366MSQ7_9BACT|nr:LLM class flavin-dependent oxidoreductase [Aliarcobacter vitoriensis]RBQ28624.1 LLM class flavin-dependent oxidoreductase [Aliarcobacter vitoriensis]
MKTALFALFENWENDYQKAITDQIDLVCYAENLGFDEAWITEHHFNNFSVIPSPLTLVNYLLGKTKNIKIGTAGILLPYYNPIKLAEEIATIKAFDDNRFLYGIAKGAFAIYDKTFHTNALTNREVMFEANELIHKLLLEEQVNFKGKFFSCEDISIRPKIKDNFTTFLASESLEAIEKCAKDDFGLIGSLALSKEKMKEIFTNFQNFSPNKKLSFRVARGINIGFDKKEIEEETKKSADIFINSMRLSKQTNPTLAKLLTSEYIDIRNTIFDKNRILENSIYGTQKECIEQIKALKNEFDIEAILLKPLTTSTKRAKEVLNLYIKEVKPYV